MTPVPKIALTDQDDWLEALYNVVPANEYPSNRLTKDYIGHYIGMKDNEKRLRSALVASRLSIMGAPNSPHPSLTHYFKVSQTSAANDIMDGRIARMAADRRQYHEAEDPEYGGEWLSTFAYGFSKLGDQKESDLDDLVKLAEDIETIASEVEVRYEPLRYISPSDLCSPAPVSRQCCKAHSVMLSASGHYRDKSTELLTDVMLGSKWRYSGTGGIPYSPDGAMYPTFVLRCDMADAPAFDITANTVSDPGSDYRGPSLRYLYRLAESPGTWALEKLVRDGDLEAIGQMCHLIPDAKGIAQAAKLMRQLELVPRFRP